MNTLLVKFLLMSFSGSCLTLLLLLGKRLWQDKVSRQWQYYIWLVVVLRLLLPFGVEVPVVNRPIQSIAQTVVQVVSPAQTEETVTASKNLTKMVNKEESTENDREVTAVFRRFVAFIEEYGGLLWLIMAFAMLLRKITVYQSFVEYVKAGRSRFPIWSFWMIFPLPQRRQGLQSLWSFASIRWFPRRW